jgi:hypothetical protein
MVAYRLDREKSVYVFVPSTNRVLVYNKCTDDFGSSYLEFDTEIHALITIELLNMLLEYKDNRFQLIESWN